VVSGQILGVYRWAAGKEEEENCKKTASFWEVICRTNGLIPEEQRCMAGPTCACKLEVDVERLEAELNTAHQNGELEPPDDRFQQKLDILF